jgi:hypothetical protein
VEMTGCPTSLETATARRLDFKASGVDAAKSGKGTVSSGPNVETETGCTAAISMPIPAAPRRE